MPTAEPQLDHVRVERDGSAGRITLARPSKLNALAPRTLRDLIAAARWLDTQPDVRAVVVAGDGRSFCAGYDLTQFGRPADDPADSDPQLGRLMCDAISGMEAITVAAVQGHCVGGGVALAASCDLRIAETHATFVIPEVDLGIPLTWGAIPRLVRELGPVITRELVLTCRPFDAAEALAWRWLNRVVPADRLEHEAVALAGEVAGKAPIATQMSRRQIDEATESLVSTRGAEREARLLAAALRDPTAREAARRYLSPRRR